MTSEGLGEMFEGDSADMCAEKFPLVSMGGRAEGLACTDPGARTPIGASGNLLSVFRGPSLSRKENVESPEIRIRKWLTEYNRYDAEPSDFQKDDALEEEEKERKDQKYKRKNKSSCIDVYILI